MVRYTQINHAGMAQLLKSDDVRAMLTHHAEPVLAAAQADPHDETGAYEAGLHIEQVTTDRAVPLLALIMQLPAVAHICGRPPGIA